jgi:hypothetical protein
MARRLGAAALGCACVLGLGASASQAQVASPPAAGGVATYDPAFFVAARPDTAYDMVLLVPGFTFDAGQEARGFASAAGNVLIDGKRPSTKFDALDDILKRIPAGSVARIEVIRGGAPGVDMQGRTVLANVVRKSSRSLVDTSDVLLTKDGRVGVTTRLDLDRRSGAEGLVASLYVFDHQGEPAGSGRKDRFDPQGRPISLAEVHFNNPNSGVQLNGELDTARWGGLLRLKGSALYGTNRGVEEDAVSDVSGFRQDLFFSEFRTRRGELSADFTRPVAPGVELSLITIQTLEKATNGDNARQAGLIINSEDDGLQGETILRATLTYARSRRWSLEVGGEEAYNFLDATSRLVIAGQPQALPSADVRVAEARAEPFATFTWKPFQRLSVEAGARYEISRLTVSGDAHNEVRFRFPKPRLVVTWTPTQADQLRARIERLVGQLDFQDFVTSSSLEQGVITGGNPELEPERDWIFEAAWDRRFGKTADVVMTVSHAELEKVIDQLPVAGFSAPGNIGNGTRDKAALDLTLPLGVIGLKDGLFKGQATWIVSRVTDPTTHQERMITNDQPFVATATITNDVPRLRSSWRFDVSGPYHLQVFRIDEIDTYRSRGWVSALWEWKPSADLAFQLQAQKVWGGVEERTRQIFTGLRSTGQLSAVEFRRVRVGPRLYFRVRKAF